MKRLRVLSAVAILAALSFAHAAGADVIFLDGDNDNVVETNGTDAHVAGSLVCSTDQIGLAYRVTATVSQGTTRLVGNTGNGVCDGTTQTFQVTAHKTQGPGLVAGSATLKVTAQTGIPHDESSDVTKASEVVGVVLP